MGSDISISKIGYEEMQNNINNNSIIINTLNVNEQECLIKNTLHSSKEEETINFYLNKNKLIKIIIYGRNNLDMSVVKKYKQLIDLGFKNIDIYCGGIFEWLLLQDIFGDEYFSTTIKEHNILKYKPTPNINKQIK